MTKSGFTGPRYVILALAAGLSFPGVRSLVFRPVAPLRPPQPAGVARGEGPLPGSRESASAVGDFFLFCFVFFASGLFFKDLSIKCL